MGVWSLIEVASQRLGRLSTGQPYLAADSQAPACKKVVLPTGLVRDCWAHVSVSTRRLPSRSRVKPRVGRERVPILTGTVKMAARSGEITYIFAVEAVNYRSVAS